MDNRNLTKLEILNAFCQLGGFIMLCVGIVIAVLELIDQDFPYVVVGVFVAIIGWAFLNISDRLTMIIIAERLNETDSL